MKKVIISIILGFVIISGCSPEQAKSTNSGKVEEDKSNLIEKDRSVEKMIEEGPGTFAGNSYDEEKIKAELDKIQNGDNKEEIYTKLIQLLAEDYSPLFKELKEFNTDFEFQNTEVPDGVESPASTEKIMNAVILLDASGSMEGKIDGESKMSLAKEAVKNFAQSLPEGSNLELRVYGHKGSNSNSDKSISCSSTEVVYPLEKYDQAVFGRALNRFKPTGWTPIAAAIEGAKEDLKSHTGENVKNIGLESISETVKS
ncbi:VWA domain-containing protein [Mechercharimyces sp. CAU 1602]|uniref:VWA domain-containing protein n=1 Tax=Mechercharimyces sp. CAU 1602 TaxID=2973933 RepID=UPI0021618523|nr:VWA domain-containing protein [Mechercharimyces sp. CAU 1602]MCS1352414.1 VWA domain-containing protein [Mechercharimyces sp. CAU 1602]